MSTEPAAPRSQHRAAQPLTDEQIAGYLARIGLPDAPEPTVDGLQRLQVAHVLAVPFENLDIHLGRPIRLDTPTLFDKIVTRRRGGFCYELNGLFAGLLQGLGFDVTLVGSGVWLPDGSLSPPTDHLALLVDVDGTWLVDVGFGETFTVPHRLGEEWAEPAARFRTVHIEGGWRLQADEGAGWVDVYDVDPSPLRLVEFAARCDWHQTDNASFFRHLPFVSQATSGGRVTIMGEHRIVRADGVRSEHAVSEVGGIVDAAQGHFDVTLIEHLRQLSERNR